MGDPPKYITTIKKEGGLDFYDVIESLFKDTILSYPDIKSSEKLPINKSFREVWDGVFNSEKGWNINHIVAESQGTGIKMCPVAPLFITNTVGSVALARKMNTKDSNDWLAKNYGHVYETSVYMYLKNTFEKINGTIIQGLRTYKYLNLLTSFI